jgi:hypothetical protein
MTPGSSGGGSGIGVGERLAADAARLSVPRYPGTEGDRQTVARLERLLRAAGLEAETQPFSYDLAPATRALSTMLVAGGLLTAAAGLVAVRSPLVAGLILVSALIPGLLFLAWSPWLERLYRRHGPTRTANVIGKRPTAGPRLTMIVMAHHDSKSQTLSLPIRMTLTAVAAATMLALAAACGVGILAGRIPGPAWLAPTLGCTAGAAAMLLATMRSGNRSPGGVDNGGSLAILLELARTLPELVHDRVELVFLSTGAEEDHMVGAMRWLDATADGLVGRPVFCLNLDGAGAPGRVVLIERFGFGRRFSPVLSRVARQAARELGIRVRGILMLPGLGIDAIPFAHRGIDCLTLASGSLGRATMSVHSARDIPDHLDPATLECVFRLAQHIVLELVQAPKSEIQ